MLAGVALSFLLSFLACGGATPRDINFGKDAGTDFTPPDLAGPATDTTADTNGAAGIAGGTAGASGTAGSTAGASGTAGGAAGSMDDASDAEVSDGG